MTKFEAIFVPFVYAVCPQKKNKKNGCLETKKMFGVHCEWEDKRCEKRMILSYRTKQQLPLLAEQSIECKDRSNSHYIESECDPRLKTRVQKCNKWRKSTKNEELLERGRNTAEIRLTKDLLPPQKDAEREPCCSLHNWDYQSGYSREEFRYFQHFGIEIVCDLRETVLKPTKERRIIHRPFRSILVQISRMKLLHSTTERLVANE